MSHQGKDVSIEVSTDGESFVPLKCAKLGGLGVVSRRARLEADLLALLIDYQLETGFTPTSISITVMDISNAEGRRMLIDSVKTVVEV
jgi:hypothetical protein